jgi:hypothetical protein
MSAKPSYRFAISVKLLAQKNTPVDRRKDRDQTGAGRSGWKLVPDERPRSGPNCFPHIYAPRGDGPRRFCLIKDNTPQLRHLERPIKTQTRTDPSTPIRMPKNQQRRDIEVPAVPSPDKSWSYGLNEVSRSPMHRPIEFGNHPQGHCHRIVIVNEAIHFLDPSSPRDRWTRRQVPLQSSQCFISAL